MKRKYNKYSQQNSSFAELREICIKYNLSDLKERVSVFLNQKSNTPASNYIKPIFGWYFQVIKTSENKVTFISWL
jgi:hypothetical protein